MCCAQLAWPAARPMHVPLLHESGGGTSLRSATAYQAPLEDRLADSGLSHQESLALAPSPNLAILDDPASAIPPLDLCGFGLPLGRLKPPARPDPEDPGPKRRTILRSPLDAPGGCEVPLDAPLRLRSVRAFLLAVGSIDQGPKPS